MRWRAGAGTHAQSQTLFKAPFYNVVNDFTPVALITEVPIVPVVRKDLPSALRRPRFLNRRALVLPQECDFG